MRYVLEGTWTGYTSAQSRVCHREVISAARAERLRGLHKIIYTDGTALLIHVREAKYRERIVPNLSYRELIRDAEKIGAPVATPALALTAACLRAQASIIREAGR